MPEADVQVSAQSNQAMTAWSQSKVPVLVFIRDTFFHPVLLVLPELFLLHTAPMVSGGITAPSVPT